MNAPRYTSQVFPDEMQFVRAWVESLIAPRRLPPPLTTIQNGYGRVQESLSYDAAPLCLHGRTFDSGLAAHADSEVRVPIGQAVRQFHAVVGVDENTVTRGISPARIIFSVEARGRELWRSPPLAVDLEPVPVEVPLEGATDFILKATAADGRIGLAHADWADARVQLENGEWLSLARTVEERRYPRTPPFSFRCGDRPAESFFASGRHEVGDLANGIRPHRFRWQDSATGLACTCEMKAFEDFPAVEWVVHFTNTGREDTPLLTDIRALDMEWTGSPAILHRSRGSDENPLDFQYFSEAMRTIRGPRSIGRMTSGGPWATPGALDGRSSVEWLPFFNLQTGGDGIILAVGWSGAWAAEFLRGETGTIRVRAGMESARLKLRPGETIRTPRMLLLYWRGDPIHGHNLLRQLLLRHHTPHYDGQPLLAPICNGSWGGSPTDHHRKLIDRIQKQRLKYDYYWIDAGWYGVSEQPCPNVFAGDWWKVGDWRVNRRYHPETLKPLSDAAHAAGMKFLLWVEPERALYGVPITREHPEWFLSKTKAPPKEGENVLLNLGHPEARRWVIDLISNLITENGIDCYRQDFNLGQSAEHLRCHDEPGRQGMNEIRYIEGLYEFWDELRRRHPRLLIDNCASGGRRIDLETIHRSIPLWRSDYNCFAGINPDALQIQSCGLAHWVPLSAASPCARPGDTYQFRSNLSAGMVFNIEEFGLQDGQADEGRYPWDWHRKMMDDFHRARPCYYGDFYPLMSCSLAADTWMAYQLHRPDRDEGLLLAFRREQSPLAMAVLGLRGLTAGATYEIEDADSAERVRWAADQLTQPGYQLAMPERRSSRLLFYQRVE